MSHKSLDLRNKILAKKKTQFGGGRVIVVSQATPNDRTRSEAPTKGNFKRKKADCDFNNNDQDFKRRKVSFSSSDHRIPTRAASRNFFAASVSKCGESISKNPRHNCEASYKPIPRACDDYNRPNHDRKKFRSNDEKSYNSFARSFVERGRETCSTKTGESMTRRSDHPNDGHTTTSTAPMSYTSLKNLCDDKISPDEASSQLSGNTQLQRFEALLRESHIRFDLMKLIISVIDKVCQSRIPSHLNTILGILNKTQFLWKLGVFISEMETTHEFLADPCLSSMIKQLCKIFINSLERLPHLHSHVPFYQLQNAVKFVKEKVLLDSTVDCLLMDVARRYENIKKGIREKRQAQAEPPNDFRSLSVFPTDADILEKRKPFLRENIVKRPFSSVDQYLDIHFRLLKEDSIAGLRNGFFNLRRREQRSANHKLLEVSGPKNDVLVYNDVVIEEPVTRNRQVAKGVVYNVTFNSKDRSIKRVKWARSKRLMHGGLVCLISSDFERLHFATVENRNADLLQEGRIQLCFEADKCPTFQDMEEHYWMIESSSAYFVAYRHILERLKDIKEETMPCKDYIVFCEHEIAKPGYFKVESEEGNEKTINLQSIAEEKMLYSDESTHEALQISPYDLTTWPDGHVIGLNESQYEAFRSALQREFTVIQGPPGTGKTYVGLKIAHTLLDNSHLWKDTGESKSCPILMLAYTNHALDSFLEGLTIDHQDIIRVGSRSSSEALKQCNLHVVRREDRNTRQRGRFSRTRRRFYEVKHELEDCQNSLNRLTDVYVKSFKGILPAREFDKCMLTEHKHYLLDNEIDMVEFLEIQLKQQKEQNATILPDEKEDFENFQEHELGGYFFAGDSAPFEGDEKRESKNILLCYAEETSSPEEILRFLKADLPERLVDFEARTQNAELFQDLNVEQRWILYLLWLSRLRENLNEEIRQKQTKYLDLSSEYEELRNVEDLSILRSSRVVGMTTTWASKNHKLLQQLRPRVVIIEEAAELFEAHIVSCLTEYCQHLILIGDHQQLRPKPSVYNLSVKYSLDVSLLERMIEAGVPYNRLSVQHRMRPEISKIFRHIYDGLEDHQSVTDFENIRGITKNLFFIDHDVRESVQENRSKVNQHEAEFLVELCLYLLRQGYQSSQITVLTTYTGQMFTVRDHIKTKKDEFEEAIPRVSSVDNFQGEENDIILLSLVRNNEEENIGFLKTKNRVCVALSRARKGLYIIGNKAMLEKQSPLWKKVLADLERDGCVGKSLPLVCSNHQTEKRVSRASDFKKFVPNGGCLEKCHHRLECGHACSQMCHPNGHETVKCIKPCPKKVRGCKELGHKCTKLCHEDCDYECQYPVNKVLKCGHTKTLACGKDVNLMKCDEQCEKTLLCGHRCQTRCSEPCSEKCMELVKKVDFSCGHENTMACSATQKDCNVPCATVLECEHPCPGSCGQCIQGRAHVKCKKKCHRILVCSHQCKSSCTKTCPPCNERCSRKCYHSTCNHKCGLMCIPCQEECPWECQHYKCSHRCSDICDRPRCNAPCDRKLRCGKGHVCRSLCEERCVCVICHKNNGKNITEIMFGSEDEKDARFIRLKDCEHIFEYKALDRMMDSRDESGEVVLKVCPLCRTPIVKSLRYGNVVKRILKDVDAVKKKLLASTEELKEKILKVKDLQSEIHPEVDKISREMRSTPIERSWKTTREYVNRSKPSSVFLQDMELVEYEMRLLKNWLCIKKSLDAARNQKQIRTTSLVEFESEMEHLLNRIIKSPVYTSVHILSQLNVELQRMHLKKDVLVIGINRDLLNQAEKDIVALVSKKLQNKEIIKEDALQKLTKEVSHLSSRFAPATAEEKIQIVRAVGLKTGHWFKCPNGHFYAIGECGGAMEQGICPECKATIGGESHQLESGNELAPEMDGATFAAWSDQANMQNYQFVD